MNTKNKAVQAKTIRAEVLFLFLLLGGLAIPVMQSAFASEQKITLSASQKSHINQLSSILPADQQVGGEAQFEDRVTVVTFFASWCPPCLDEFKALNAINSQLGTDNITIVALNVFEEFDDNDEVRMAKFLQTTQPEFRVLEGTEESRQLFGGVNRIPTLFVYDRSGELAFNFVHKRGASKQSVEANELLNAIKPLI